MRTAFRPALVAAQVVAAATLAACGRDVTAPDLAPGARPSLLLSADEGMRVITDTVIGANHIMVAEYAAGVYLTAGTAPVASVTIRTVIPMGVSGTESSVCITSTIEQVETTPGWAYQIKKSGGCNSEIRVGLENSRTREKAQFSFLMIPGKTKIDSGLIQ